MAAIVTLKWVYEHVNIDYNKPGVHVKAGTTPNSKEFVSDIVFSSEKAELK